MMIPPNILSYIRDCLQIYLEHDLPKDFMEYLPKGIPDCSKVLGTIQNTCVPVSSMMLAITVYSIVALLLSL
jgi:hypothetical protein